MKRREFFQRIGSGTALPAPQGLELACDLLQVDYAEALLENREQKFLADLRKQMEKARRVTVRNEGLLRGETQTLFQNLFAEYEARGKHIERRRS